MSRIHPHSQPTSQSQSFPLLSSPHSASHRSPIGRSGALAFAVFGIYAASSLSTALAATSARAPKALLTQVPAPQNSRIAVAQRTPRVRLAQAQTNTPAANEDDKKEPGQPKEELEVPVGPEQEPGPGPNTEEAPAEPAPAEEAPVEAAPGAETPAEATPPVEGGTPVLGGEDNAGGATATIGGLTATEAEGREIAEVRVVGNRVVPAQSILLQSTTRRGSAFTTRQIDIDRAKIQSLGFFASVQYQVTPNLEDPAKVDLAFIVEENRVVTGFKFQSATPTKLQVDAADLTGTLDTKTQMVLNLNTINSDVRKLEGIYKERGLAALVTDARILDDGTVLFTLREATISRVEVVGLKKTRPNLIRKQITIKSGDPFDQNAIGRDRNRIYDLGFFEDVALKVEEDPTTEGGFVVTFTPKEKRTGQFSVGLGFDSRSKVTGFLTLSENNFQGRGRRIYGSVEAGGQRTFDLGFGNPFIGKSNSSFDVNIFDRRVFREPSLLGLVLNKPTAELQRFFFEEQRQGVRLNFTRPIGRKRERSLLFGYRNERARLFQTDTTEGVLAPIAGLPAEEEGTISAFSIGFLRDVRDLRLDPSRGSREQILLESALKFGGSRTFTKVDIDLRRYIPILGPAKKNEPPRMIFATRVVLGRSFGQLPAFEQYFIGGSDTVRGYDVDTQLGNNQFYSNFELRFRFQRKLQLVGFVDVGKAGGGIYSARSFNGVTVDNGLLYSAGGGVRLQTPIGPIRLDIGFGRNGARTHFAIGSTF